MPTDPAASMTKVLFHAVAVIATVAATPVLAEDCAQASTQAAMNECAGNAFKQADAELNAVYNEIARRLKDNEPAAKLLADAQRKWLAFRDAECAFASSASAAGSVLPMLLANCRAGLTRQRTAGLKAYLSCEEGDLTCPVPAN